MRDKKIIFLDIDGVLNHREWFMRPIMKTLTGDKKWFCPTSVVNLNTITDKTGAKIVVSSTWRLMKNISDLRDLFREVGITGEVIGMTPRYIVHGKERNMVVPRGFEIEKFLESLDNFVNFVILDDDSDMLLDQKDHFIQIDNRVGLTETDVKKAIYILN